MFVISFNICLFIYFSVKYAIQSNDCDVFLNKQSIYHLVFVLTFISSADTKGCKISVDAATSLGKPQYNNQPRQPTYSCTPGSSSSSQYEVHVLSVYEVISRRPPTAGDATVNISGGRPDRPLVLVLASYEPVNWILKLPSDVTISRVILVRTQKRQLYDK